MSLCRAEKNIGPTDFLSRLISLRKRAKVPEDEVARHASDDIIVTQGQTFYLAGFMPTTGTLSAFVYNLAKNPDVQVITT